MVRLDLLVQLCDPWRSLRLRAPEEREVLQQPQTQVGWKFLSRPCHAEEQVQHPVQR